MVANKDAYSESDNQSSGFIKLIKSLASEF
jgi:hypothetical protein